MNLLSIDYNKISTLLITCFVFVNAENNTEIRTTNAYSANTESNLRDYEKKICNHEATCHLVDSVPAPYRDLRRRNCMCDKKCSDYDDCCSDSTFKNSANKHQFECVSTFIDGNIYMKASCPESWNQSTTVIENCRTRNVTLLTVDVLLRIPVTDTANGITYKNMFCALCHDKKQFEFWNVGFRYDAIPKVDATKIVVSPTSNNTEYAIVYDKSNTSVLVEDEVTIAVSDLPTVHTIVAVTELPTVRVSDILENLDLEFNDNDTYWFSNVSGSFYRCLMYAKLSKNLETRVRYCVLEVIDRCSDTVNCPDDYTSYTTTPEDDQVYKNRDCLRCNGKSTKRATGCRPAQSSFDGEPFSIDINDTVIKKINHCAEIPQDSSAFKLLCENKAAVKFKANRCFGSSCLVNDYFGYDDYIQLTNETIYLKSLGVEFPYTEWMPYPGKGNGTIFVCGRTIPRTKFQKIFHFLDDVFTELLIKMSIICIFLHLLVFFQLAELQNLSGKSLASFCVALMSAFLLFEIGQVLPSCEITAAIEHYCFLVCFTWMLTISYDVWLSLYRATSQFRTSGGKHNTKFLIYSIISWTLPAIIVGVAVFYELAPTEVVSCEQKPGYGKYGQCFIGQKKPYYNFFFIPASIIFGTNICFFTHSACMIYLSQRTTVNPNTRHDFRLYTRLALLMGMTWTLGLLVTITNNVIVGLLFSVFNMSQGIFIFFGFTFKKKVLKGLLQKHRNNRVIFSALSTFAATDTIPSDDTTKQTQSESV